LGFFKQELSLNETNTPHPGFVLTNNDNRLDN